MPIQRPTLIYGLIGYPLKHSFSQNYFRKKFGLENINADYLNFEMSDIGDFMEIIAEYPSLIGINVTIPYKEQILPYLNEIDADAAEIGAVNVIKITNHGNNDIKIKGYNTDITGFTRSIQPLLKPSHRKALILGNGGASKAVAQGLKKLGIGTTCVSRSAGNGRLTYEELSTEIMQSHTLIVNTTPVGMYPHTDEAPAIPYRLLTPEHLCYDLIYNPDETLFLRYASERGASTKNGMEMLILQADAAWQIWNKQ